MGLRTERLETAPSYMRSSAVGDKALELVAEHRVILLQYGDPCRAIVTGEHGHYRVNADEHGMTCTCPSRKTYCSHIVAAMIVWHDYLEAQRGDLAA
jgi:uncharacterized Zn finger protein